MLSRFQCFIDTSDIAESVLIALPSPNAVDKEGAEYFDDYFIQIVLSSVEGTLYFILFRCSRNSSESLSPTTKDSANNDKGTIHFQIEFKSLDKIPNQLRKRIVIIMVEKLNKYCLDNKNRVKNFTSTYVPFYDQYTTCPGTPFLNCVVARANSDELKKKRITHRLKLKDKSEILTNEMLRQLSNRISPLLLMRPWEVRFRINSDGVSMRTFFTKLEKYNPTIFLVQDANNCVFGALVSEIWHSSTRFYGTGEAFLFTFKVSLKVME
jgi:hypothetical protein